MGFKSTVVNTPLSPFSDFLASGGKWQSNPSHPNYEKNAVILISAGSWSFINTLSQKGITASGLYGILRTAYESGVPLNTSSSIGYDGESTSFVYNSPEKFINHLDQINNNINDIIRQFIPDISYTDQDGNLEFTGPLASRRSANAFNYLKNIMFPGSYTGNGGGVLPTRVYNSVSLPDVTGNGITGAFVVYDQPSGEHVLSRTGIEFYTVLTALAYGATVAVGGDYTLLSSIRGNSTNTARPLTTNADAFMMLDMSTYIDGQGITLASSDSRLIYGGSETAYALGNTFNYCHGLTAQWLNSIYTEITKRNNVLNGTLDENATANTKSAYIIHAGLSGAAISLNQNTSSGDYTDINRYPGFDGKASLYQNTPNTAGFTAYTLIEDPYLDRLLCVIGKKTRIITSVNFGNPTNNQLTLEIPLVADVAGALQRAKVNNAIYQSAVGFPNSTLLNADSVAPFISSTSEYASTLRSKRVNFYVNTSNGLVLSTDLVGATSSDTSIDINDRIGVTSMKRVITDIAKVVLEAAITNNRANNSSVRAEIANEIKSQISLNQGLNASLNNVTTVVVNFLTDATVSADITFFPIQAAFGATTQDTLLNGYTLTVTAQ